MNRTTCAHCRKKLTPEQQSKRLKLHPECLNAYAEAVEAKAIRRQVKEAKALAAQERKTTRERKAALKTIPELIKEAQREFNAFIRARDRLAGHPCISSGRLLDWSGNGVDAGHYRSIGSASHLRFDERNCHAQSKHDNQWKSGNAVDYRIGLIQRIGLEAVEALEADNRIHKWTRDELVAIRETYKQKRKELERAEERETE